MAKNDKKSEQAIVKEAPAGALVQIDDYGDDSRAGTKELSAAEKSIPFLTLLQDNSPELKKIPGSRPGQFLNTVSKELYNELIVQPVYCDQWVVEWKDRDKGGGFVGRHAVTSPEVDEAKNRNGGSLIGTKEKPVKHGENFLVDTRYLYLNILTDDGQEFSGGYAILPASKSKIGPVSKFVTVPDMMRGGPPLFAMRARMSSVVEIQKGSGKEYYNVRFLPFLEGETWQKCLIPAKAEGSDKKHPLLVAGRAFYDAIKGGTAKVDFEQQGSDTEGGGESESANEKRHF